jgi:hypothetical protein
MIYKDGRSLALYYSKIVYVYIVGDMPESPSSQYGLKAQEDIDPKRD